MFLCFNGQENIKYKYIIKYNYLSEQLKHNFNNIFIEMKKQEKTSNNN